MKASGFVTLMTDFGIADGFVGIMKGVIYTINPKAVIIDISHEIQAQDIHGAAFLLEASYKYFPAGTVHTVVVDPGVGSQRRSVAIETDRYYFVAPDNGVFTPVLHNENVLNVVELTEQRYFLDRISNTFHGRDIFAPIAAYLSKGVPMDKMGGKAENLIRLDFPEPEVDQVGITGKIIHIDRFGNLITNISQGLFDKIISGRHFSINLADVKLDRVNTAYAGVDAGEPLAIFNSFDSLEIGINCGSAAKILNSQKGDIVRIKLD